MNHAELRKAWSGVSSLLFVTALLLGGSPLVCADRGGVYSIYDADRDGFLDKEEFEKFAETKRNRQNAADIWRFENVDVDGDNKIQSRKWSMR